MVDNDGHLYIDESLTWRLLDGDAVIVSPQTGKIRVLNHVGAFIWQKVVDKLSISEIVEAITTNYGISPQQAQTDLDTFIDDLAQRDMIFRERPR
ncbi:MAG: PqqD family protein [Ardenticatenaceae bacterium]|nr:PqqD family protein [Anaerolineales bacterium]MCB8985131.1 PqqD family protein [Ardenticatenaceae bacterium]MCB8986673.1 PqqD family protein [Ardenticatenaceae bacterium]